MYFKSSNDLLLASLFVLGVKNRKYEDFSFKLIFLFTDILLQGLLSLLSVSLECDVSWSPQ
jgi:hypothetical protein